MNPQEEAAIDKYESLGYDVIKNGTPDLILLKDGKISFVEIKSYFESPISEGQKRAINLLRKHGYSVELRVWGYKNDGCFDRGEYDMENRKYRPYESPIIGGVGCDCEEQG